MNLQLAQPVIVTHFVRTIRHDDGSMSWVVRPWANAKAGYYMGTRKIRSHAIQLIEPGELPVPFSGLLEVDLVIFDTSHNPAWVLRKYLTHE